MVVSFLAGQGGTQAAASTQFSSSVKEGMLVYDDTDNALKICNGTVWQTLAVGGGSVTAAGTVAGAVQFRGTTGALEADDANFIWDDTNNRLGIGTATPQRRVHIAQSANAGTGAIIENTDTGTTAHVAIEIRNGASQAESTRIGSLGTGWTTNGRYVQNGGYLETQASLSGGLSIAALHASAPIRFYSGGGTERMRIDFSGNVSIGTTTPNASSLLDLSSTTKGFLPPRMTSAQVGAISSAADGLIVYDTDADTIKLRANGAWVDLLAGSGSETDPQVGTLTASKWCAANAGGTAIDCTADAPATGAAGSASEIQFRNNSTGAFAANSNFVWDNTNARVGIGTASPTLANLQIETIDASANIVLRNIDSTVARFPGMSVYNFGGTVGGAPSISGINSRGNSASPSPVQSGDTLMQIVGNGQYSTTPWQTHQAAAITLLASGAFAPTSAPTAIAFSTTASGSTARTERVRITDAGNVGIGDTAPNTKLVVSGGARVGADATCTIAKAGMLAWNANVLQVCTDAGTFANIASSGGAGALPSGVAGTVQVSDGAGAFTNSDGAAFFWDNTNKRLGIGTTAPGYKLDVSGDVRATGTLLWGNAASRTQTKDDAGAIASKSGFFETAAPTNYYTGASSWQHMIEARHSNDANNYALQIAGSFFDQDLYFRKTNGSGITAWNKLVYANSAGNVGIGNSNPQSKLHVGGGIQIADDTATCPGAGNIKVGTLRYNSNALNICLTGGWTGLATGSSSTFTDVGSDSYTTDDIAIGQASAPETSAALEVESTTKGFLPPRMTRTQRDAIVGPASGLLIFNTSDSQLQYYTGTAWIAVGQTEAVNPSTPLLVTWGMNTVGELGNGTTTLSPYLGSVVSPPSNIVSMDGGGYFNGTAGAFCVITTGNALWCWGSRYHLMGDAAVNKTTPFNSTSGLAWKMVDEGSALSSCGITTSDLIYCWGRQETNGLGNGLNNSTEVDVPTGPVGGAGVTWSDLAIGGFYNGSSHIQFGCGIKISDSRIYCWGNDSYGQQGNNAGGSNYTATPAIINSALTFKSMVAGGYHVCAIDSNDDAYCWGAGTNGQLGNAASAHQQSPVAVSGGRKWEQLSAGIIHTCGIEKNTGLAYCWGDGAQSELGNGPATTDSNVPVAVIGAKTWTKLVSGRYHTCGIDSSSRIFCWGYGTSGQIGDGNTTTRNAPTLVWGDYTFSDLAASSDSVLAITK
ncbi:hypothetical protein [Hyphomicrobium sp.]|uniref:hypothetical protein n=1 Tax=Hyphomicrobium sp. TaxID=82 RepID=UPI003D0C7873